MPRRNENANRVSRPNSSLKNGKHKLGYPDVNRFVQPIEAGASALKEAFARTAATQNAAQSRQAQATKLESKRAARKATQSRKKSA